MEEEDLVGVVLASLGEGVPSLVVGVAYPAEGAFLGEVVPNHLQSNINGSNKWFKYMFK